MSTDMPAEHVVLPEIRCPSESVAWELWEKLVALAAELGCEVTVGGVVPADVYDAEGDNDEPEAAV